MSESPAGPPTTPFWVTNALTFSSPPVASSSGAALAALKNVALGSTGSHVPAVRPGPLEMAQPATDPSMLSLRVICVPTAESARYDWAGAVGGSDLVPLPPPEAV